MQRIREGAYQRASNRPFTILDSQRRNGLLPFLMQAPLRTSKAHSCFGQVKRAAFECQVRNVGALVRTAAVVDADVLLVAVDEQPAAVAIDPLHVA